MLPLVRRVDRPGPLGVRRSLPAAYGGLVSEGGLLSHRDVTAILADLGAGLRGSIVMTPGSDTAEHYDNAEGWTSITRKWSQVLDLSGGFEEVWAKRFSSAVRGAVRKAERSEIVVVRDTTGQLLPQFHELYQMSVVRWAEQSGVPPAVARFRASRRESLDRLRGMAGAMGESCVTWMAFVDGAPAASIIVLTQGAHSHYWHGAMNIELARPVCANDLLHRRAIEEACVRGHEKYWLGRGTPGTGLWRFKAGFGAVPAPFATYRMEQLPLTQGVDLVRSTAKRALRAKSRLRR